MTNGEVMIAHRRDNLYECIYINVLLVEYGLHIWQLLNTEKTNFFHWTRVDVQLRIPQPYTANSQGRPSLISPFLDDIAMNHSGMFLSIRLVLVMVSDVQTKERLLTQSRMSDKFSYYQYAQIFDAHQLITIWHSTEEFNPMVAYSHSLSRALNEIMGLIFTS